MAKGLKLSEAVEADIPRSHGHLDISVDDLPEIKNWKVGSTYDLVVSVKMTALKDGEYGDKGLRASFEIKHTEVEEDDNATKTAKKINEYKKNGLSPSSAVRLARKR